MVDNKTGYLSQLTRRERESAAMSGEEFNHLMAISLKTGALQSIHSPPHLIHYHIHGEMITRRSTSLANCSIAINRRYFTIIIIIQDNSKPPPPHDQFNGAAVGLPTW